MFRKPISYSDHRVQNRRIRTKRISFIILFLAILMLACQAINIGSESDSVSQETKIALTVAGESANRQKTAEANQAAAEVPTLTTKATDLIPTEVIQASATPLVSPTATEDLQAQQGADATSTSQTAVNQATTAQSQSMYNRMLELVDDDVLNNAEGEYYPLTDFDQSWAKLNYYKWWDTGYSPERYALQAKTWWNSASKSANWFSSGCGFVIGESDKDSHHLVYLGLDGFANLARVKNGKWKTVAKKRYGTLSTPEGEAEVMLVVLGKKVIFYVNDEKVLEVTDNLMEPGGLNLTLLSGTNKDYGTHCKMTDIGLWIFD